MIDGYIHLCNLDQLVVVVVAVEKGLLTEDHAREHAAERPHVKRVIVVLQVDQQLGALEVARGNANLKQKQKKGTTPVNARDSLQERGGFSVGIECKDA